MQINFTDEQIAALIGALVGGGIAVMSQLIFYVLAERIRLRELHLSLVKQRLDEFYSPMLTRLLEIEYKLWLDHEAQLTVSSTSAPNEQKEIWDRQLASDIAILDGQIIEIFRSKRWLAFDSTVVECQKLIRYLESIKIIGAIPDSKIAVEWGDVTRLRDLHVDVRKHHICLMEEMGIHKCGSLPLIPEEAGGFSVHGELALDKYHASLEQRSSAQQNPSE